MDVSTRRVEVTNKIIECDHQFWQISNVTNVSAQEVRFTFTNGKPKYNGVYIFWCIAGVCLLLWLMIKNGWNLYMAAGILIIIVILTVSIRRSNERIRLYNAITKMRIYELIIETNSATKSLFRSPDLETISAIKSAIRQAMGDLNTAINKVFNITTVDAKDSIINLESEIHNQALKNIL